MPSRRSSAPTFLSTLPVWGATTGRPVPARIWEISSPAPGVGSDLVPENIRAGVHIFLSTLPVRGATGVGVGSTGNSEISIHAPREGSDADTAAELAALCDFYPRSP